MANTIIAVRHGETEWNRFEKQQGHPDSPLAWLGEKQARSMASCLSALSIDMIRSSDLGRAVQTASITAEAIGMDFATEPGLRERSLGIAQGLTKGEPASMYPDDFARFSSGDPDDIIPGGESVRQRFERCTDCIENMCNKRPDRSILIVAHGGALTSFFHKALDIPLTAKRKYSLYTASINIFTRSDDLEWRLETWGETNHLRTQNLALVDDN
jgi:probable phosphoglycerate mutase